MGTQTATDPYIQLRRLYLSLLENHQRFDEFRRLLSLYELEPEQFEDEPEDAAKVRRSLNERIRDVRVESLDRTAETCGRFLFC